MNKIRRAYRSQSIPALKHCISKGMGLGYALLFFCSSVMDLVLSLVSDLVYLVSKAFEKKESAKSKNNNKRSQKNT